MQMAKETLKKDILGGIVFGIVFLVAYLNVGYLPKQAKMWPQFVSLAGIVCCGILVIKSFVQLRNCSPEPGEKAGGKALDWRKAICTGGVVALWIFLMDELGFVVTTTAAALILMLIPNPAISKKQFRLYLLIAVVFAIILYVVFGLLLNAKLPEGYFI